MKVREMSKNESKAMQICMEESSRLKLPMKMVDARYIADERKIVFRFAAENRVDFRELVKVLKDKLHIKVELHQVGPRDNAMQMGGIPHCGKEELCCKQFGHYPKITDEMLEAQGIKPSQKMYGYCGRLKCCYAYEYFPDGTLAENRKVPCGACANMPTDQGLAPKLPKPARQYLFLIRHPQTTVTDPTIYADGKTDLDLSAKGIEQSGRILEYLQTQKISQIVTSPLKRALTLASFLSDRLGIPLETQENLREISVGIWRDMREDDIKTTHPKLWEAWITKPDITRIPEGESLSEVQKRTARTINEAINTHQGNIAITFHKIAALTYLLYLEGVSIKNIWDYLKKYPITLGQIIKIDMPEGKIVERIEIEKRTH